MGLKAFIKESILKRPDTVKDLTAAIVDKKEDLIIKECFKGEFTLVDKTYVIYSMHGICMYGENGDLKMMNEFEFIKSLTNDQLYSLAQLGLNPQPVDKMQDFLNNTDQL